MKIRNGFVSNSSSSSFCILGVQSSEEELMEVLDIVQPEDTKPTRGNGCIHSFDRKIMKFCPECGKPAIVEIAPKKYFYAYQAIGDKVRKLGLEYQGSEVFGSIVGVLISSICDGGTEEVRYDVVVDKIPAIKKLFPKKEIKFYSAVTGG